MPPEVKVVLVSQEVTTRDFFNGQEIVLEKGKPMEFPEAVAKHILSHNSKEKPMVTVVAPKAKKVEEAPKEDQKGEKEAPKK